MVNAPDDTASDGGGPGDGPADDALGGRIARLPLGIVIRRQPGVTRWAKWIWRAVAVLPGAGPADWHEMRREQTDRGEAIEYHAATVTLEVHRAETEGYRVALAGATPSVYVILRSVTGGPHPVAVFGVTASAFAAQDHTDNAEDIVEPVPMPPALVAWLTAFVERHHREETFVKRKRRDWQDDAAPEEAPAREPGVYDAPTGRRRTVH